MFRDCVPSKLLGALHSALFLFALYDKIIDMRYNGGVNPFLSRKTYVDIAEWWSRTTANGQINLAKLAYDVAPAGKFHCKAVSQFTYSKRNEASARFSNAVTSVETPDDVSFIRVDDIVRFQGIFYRVTSIARREIAKTRENMKHPLSVFIIELMR